IAVAYALCTRNRHRACRRHVLDNATVPALDLLDRCGLPGAVSYLRGPGEADLQRPWLGQWRVAATVGPHGSLSLVAHDLAPAFQSHRGEVVASADARGGDGRHFGDLAASAGG